jgi:hypothetical protein
MGLPFAARAACVGDCGGDGAVTVDELVVAVTIALGSAGSERCTAVDVNADGAVTIDEIVGAVKAALEGCGIPPRLIAVSRAGQIASLDLAPPWTVRASDDLKEPIASARCRAGRCLIVHPAVDAISVVDATDLSRGEPLVLARGADPRDVALVDDHTAVVSQYDRTDLVVVDLDTRATTSIDLSELADADGLPEALRLATCGRRVFVQLQRIDHETDNPSEMGSVLAVIDLDRPVGDQVVDADPVTRGVQGIALAGPPNFDMPVDCAAGVLYVAEPEPLMSGGGAYEQVDLTALTAQTYPIDTGAEVGGFEVVTPSLYWLITHTEFGPGPSSHLTLVGGPSFETHNTFADEHVNDLALDRELDLLFYPDPCRPGPTNGSCRMGIHIFNAHSGERQSPTPIDVDFGPIELAVSR